MCLGIPGRIVEITDFANCLAKVDVSGVQRTISVKLLERDLPEPDEWVLVHVGSWGLVRDAFDVLMEAAPAGIDVTDVGRAIVIGDRSPEQLA